MNKTKLTVAAVVGVALAVACSPARQRAESAGPSTAPVACDPAVRLDRDVRVMFRNEWLSGQLALAVCRGSEAQAKELDAFKAWLGDEARAGRIRNCAMPLTMQPLSESERSAAETRLPGVKDWCFSLTANI
jgi:hypothetical protein